MTDAALADVAAPQRVAVASQTQLIWWAFRKHKLAMAGLAVVILLYIVAAIPGFFAINDPSAQNARTPFHPPEAIHLWGEKMTGPHFVPSKMKRDPDTLAAVYVPDPDKAVRLVMFGHGYSYRFLGLFETDRHLFASSDPKQPFYPFGSDRLGRCVWSRIMQGAQTSLSIGLVGVALSLVIGVHPRRHLGILRRPHRTSPSSAWSNSCWRCRRSRSGWRWRRRCRRTGRRRSSI